MKVDCPKCDSESAWYIRDGPDILLRCRCGYHKVVASELEQARIEHNTTRTEVRLPRKQSNLWFTLVTLASLEIANSAEITGRLVDLGMVFTVSDVASYLTILRSKGLVITTEVRRGVAGGSTWVLTDVCQELLGV